MFLFKNVCDLPIKIIRYSKNYPLGYTGVDVKWSSRECKKRRKKVARKLINVIKEKYILQINYHWLLGNLGFE